MGKIFGLTPGKIAHLHLRDGHDPESCPFCRADMRAIAAILRENDLMVRRVGRYFIEVEGDEAAEKKIKEILSSDKNK